MGLTGNGNIAIYAANDSAVSVWALENNSLIESFIFKYAPADFITLEGGLNYSLNIDEFPKELYTVDFWLNKVKTDSILQGCFDTTRIFNIAFNHDDSKPIIRMHKRSDDTFEEDQNKGQEDDEDSKIIKYTDANNNLTMTDGLMDDTDQDILETSITL